MKKNGNGNGNGKSHDVDMCLTHDIMFVGDSCPICRAIEEVQRHADFYSVLPNDWRRDFHRGAFHEATLVMDILANKTIAHVQTESVAIGETCSIDGGCSS